MDLTDEKSDISFSDLPVELVRHILSYASRSSLLQLAQVNRILFQLATPELWSQVSLVSVVESYEKRKKTIYMDGIDTSNGITSSSGGILHFTQSVQSDFTHLTRRGNRYFGFFGSRFHSLLEFCRLLEGNYPLYLQSHSKTSKQIFGPVVKKYSTATKRKISSVISNQDCFVESDVMNDDFIKPHDKQREIKLFEFEENCSQLHHTNKYADYIKYISVGCPESVNPTPLFVPNSILCRLFKSIKNCSKIDLSYCSNVDDKLLLTISETCGSVLEDLTMINCGLISDDGIGYLAKCSFNLRKLNIDHCIQLTDISLKTISQYCKKITHISTQGCALMTADGWNELTRSCKLSTLSLAWTGINSSATFSIARNLAESLKVLNLNYLGNLSDESIENISRYCPNIVDVSFEGCPQLSDACLLSLSNLRQLKRANFTLLTQITDHGMEVLVEGSGKYLEELFLGKCKNLTDMSILKIAEMCCGLQRIYLAGCSNICDISIISIIKNCALTVLSCPGCSITDETLMAACSLGKRLKVAQFSFCDRISPEYVCKLCYYCPRINILQLVCCKKIFNSFIIQYSQPCPSYLIGRYRSSYCSIRQPNIAKLGKMWIKLALNV